MFNSIVDILSYIFLEMLYFVLLFIDREETIDRIEILLNEIPKNLGDI